MEREREKREEGEDAVKREVWKREHKDSGTRGRGAQGETLDGGVSLAGAAYLVQC